MKKITLNIGIEQNLQRIINLDKIKVISTYPIDSTREELLFYVSRKMNFSFNINNEEINNFFEKVLNLDSRFVEIKKNETTKFLFKKDEIVVIEKTENKIRIIVEDKEYIIPYGSNEECLKELNLVNSLLEDS